MSKTKKQLTDNKSKKRCTDVIIEQFDGNINKALTHILFTYTNDELDKYVTEWSKEETRIAYNIIKNSPSIKNITDKPYRSTINTLITDSEEHITTKTYVKIFDSNTEVALKYILWTFNNDELREYVKEWNTQETKLADKLIKRKNYIDENLKSLGMTENNLPATYKSCVSTFFLRLIFSCIVCFVPLILIALFKTHISNLETIQKILNLCITVFIGCQAFSLTRIILKLIKYSRLMRYIKAEKRLTEIINKVVSNKTKQN